MKNMKVKKIAIKKIKYFIKKIYSKPIKKINLFNHNKKILI